MPSPNGFLLLNVLNELLICHLLFDRIRNKTSPYWCHSELEKKDSIHSAVLYNYITESVDIPFTASTLCAFGDNVNCNLSNFLNVVPTNIRGIFFEN